MGETLLSGTPSASDGDPRHATTPAGRSARSEFGGRSDPEVDLDSPTMLQRGGSRPLHSGRNPGYVAATFLRSLGRHVTVAGIAALVLVLGSCSWVSGIFGGEDASTAKTISVFDIQSGQCFNPPATVESEIPELAVIPCDQGHLQESYAIVDYVIADGAPDSFPGQSALTSFAEGACAEAFLDYVGISYLDSSLYYTYLLPSARSWEQSDRKIVCFVTTTGETLTASVAGSKR